MKNKLLPVILASLFAGCVFISCNRKITVAKALIKNHSLADSIIDDTSFAIIPGVKEIHLHYLNAAGEPMHIYIAEVKLEKGKIGLEAATPFNKPAYARQVLTEMAKYENALHHQVIAGVNSDFFDLKTGEPRGIEYKNGTAIKNTTYPGRSFFGLLNNGKIVMGDSLLFIKDSAQLQEALGGYPLLIKDGKIIPQKKDAFSTTRHPRTAVGIINKNKIVFIVIDGRQKKYSNGMPLEELAQLMKMLHAKYAMNLDGGGSSTFISLDTAAHFLKVRNKPSDGKERKVANGWLIVSYEE